jgi:hypothetical protein
MNGVGLASWLLLMLAVTRMSVPLPPPLTWGILLISFALFMYQWGSFQDILLLLPTGLVIVLLIFSPFLPFQGLSSPSWLVISAGSITIVFTLLGILARKYLSES